MCVCVTRVTCVREDLLIVGDGSVEDGVWREVDLVAAGAEARGEDLEGRQEAAALHVFRALVLFLALRIHLHTEILELLGVLVPNGVGDRDAADDKSMAAWWLLF